jgi:hypothetical protein
MLTTRLLQNMFVITRLLTVAAANDAASSAVLSPVIIILSVGFSVKR